MQQKVADLVGSKADKLEKPVQATRPGLSAYQIADLRREAGNLQLQLESVREALENNRNRLRELCDKQAKAERLLSLTADMPGYSSDRQRAEWILKDCAEDRPKLESSVKGRAAHVEQLEAALQRINKSCYVRQQEVDQLRKELNS